MMTRYLTLALCLIATDAVAQCATPSIPDNGIFTIGLLPAHIVATCDAGYVLVMLYQASATGPIEYYCQAAVTVSPPQSTGVAK